jgi:GDP-L-fucose synthase
MRIFVTGGTGFLGKAFVTFLKEKDHEVDYCSSKKVINTVYGFEEVIDFSKISFKNYDLVIHCAAFTGGLTTMVSLKEDLISVNVKMTTDLLQACARDGVKNFIYISSSAVYPSSEEFLKEEQGFEGDPDDFFFGIGWMKRFGEKLCQYHYKNNNMNCLVIRPSNIYGPGDHFGKRAHVIPALIEKFLSKDNEKVEVFGSPYVIRDFIYIEDFIRIVCDLFFYVKGFETINVASGEPIYMEKLVRLIKCCTASLNEYYFCSPEKITRKVQKIDTHKLQFLYKTNIFKPLPLGITKTIDYYLHLN